MQSLSQSASSSQCLQAICGKISILLLAWTKAFERIASPAMVTALGRFGLPQHMIDIVAEIYSDCTFQVKDNETFSGCKVQARGIAQGCPLSPYLFIIMLPVILDDTDCKSQEAATQIIDTTYADDMLLTSNSIPDLQICLDNLIDVAGAYGLRPNWKITKHLQVGHSPA